MSDCGGINNCGGLGDVKCNLASPAQQSAEQADPHRMVSEQEWASMLARTPASLADELMDYRVIAKNWKELAQKAEAKVKSAAQTPAAVPGDARQPLSAGCSTWTTPLHADEQENSYYIVSDDIAVAEVFGKSEDSRRIALTMASVHEYLQLWREAKMNAHVIQVESNANFVRAEAAEKRVAELEAALATPAVPQGAEMLIAGEREAIDAAFSALEEAPELNMDNYDADQVEVLNSRMVDAYCALEPVAVRLAALSAAPAPPVQPTPRETAPVDAAVALDELVRLSSHYATLLNQYDGGKRMTFASGADWIARLRKIGRLDA